ncbi:conserved hypothetical protein [Chloroherpeton thalassium ATCC 35110]|uniref:Uncharacterized protein n=1 Tax=Chloroherpeton thalassium (strain ATCC 35110 / GB-78) TaxID=517418 RepID=B3QWC3_CHLT3|nr:hypothetical protein [Chloroherpeton thalassium]ACF13236.1 conserved hypothetical protein [Chloroherpeton thalassium ATCC 35110]
MRKADILNELESLARQTGYRVRYEKGDFAGGSCRVKAEQLLVVNKFLPVEGKIATIARALAQTGIGNIYINPQVRKIIDDEAGETINS